MAARRIVQAIPIRIILITIITKGGLFFLPFINFLAVSIANNGIE